MVRFTRFHEKYVSVFLYLVAFLCNELLKNRTDARNENICIFSKNGLFNSQSFMAIGGKVVRCSYRLIPFVAKNRSNSFVAKEQVDRNFFSTRCKLNLSLCLIISPLRHVPRSAKTIDLIHKNQRRTLDDEAETFYALVSVRLYDAFTTLCSTSAESDHDERDESLEIRGLRSQISKLLANSTQLILELRDQLPLSLFASTMIVSVPRSFACVTM